VFFLLAILLATVSISGCAGVASTPANPAAPPGTAQLTVTPNSVSLNSTVGTSGSTQSVTATNSGTAALSVSQVNIAGAGFTMSGLTPPPFSLSAGQSKNFTVMFGATSAGTVNGSLTIMTNASASPVVVPLKGTGAATASSVSSVTISPASSTASTGATVQFSASVQGSATDKSVTWKATLGTITSAGLYTAPASAGSDAVTATSNADTTKSASAAVAVTGSTLVVTSVTVSPSPASTSTGGTIQFTGTVAGTVSNKSVTWSAAHGSITAAGLYTAPAAAGTDTVTATSAADTTKSTASTVTVSAPVVTSVTVSPSSTSLATGATRTFTATVAGTVTDTSVIWAAKLGSISAGGVYTAPSSAGTDTITATSNADKTKSGTATVTVSVPQSNGSLPAFPSAQGGGAAATGGRGGQVIEVTNLNDSGAGSLRDCAQASGPRTCVFRVAGVIHPATAIAIRNSNLTIAGQTAPGSGITLSGDKIGVSSLFFITANDVVIRYLTCSIGLGGGHSPGPSTGAGCFELASGNNQHNVVFDHLTLRWWDDKPYLMLSNSGFSPITNTVMQWTLMYEPNNGHQVGPMTDDTGGFAGSDTNDDFHHNMFVNIGHRLPLYNTRSGRWVNNIVYNWDFYALLAQGGVKIDIINNKYVAGNLNSTNTNHEFDFNNSQSSDDPAGSMPGPPSPYITGNIGPHQSNPAGDQTVMTSQGSEAGDTGGAVPSSWFRSSPLAAEAFPINADPASSLDSVLLSIVGNSRMVDCNGNWVNRRDSVDTRIITQYQNKSAGGYFTTADSTHSIPSIAAGTPCTESLHDGIPDQWKIDQGLSTTDLNLYKATAPNGYTYLENYINGPGGSASLKSNARGWHFAAARPDAVLPNADAEKRARMRFAPASDSSNDTHSARAAEGGARFRIAPPSDAPVTLPPAPAATTSNSFGRRNSSAGPPRHDFWAADTRNQALLGLRDFISTAASADFKTMLADWLSWK
jgi:uncharacterized protein YjdB